MNYIPKKILVTGGAGFIGANFIHHLLNNNQPYFIVNLDLLTYAGRLENLSQLPKPDHYTFIHGDICNRDLVDKILHEHQIDTIVHFAAETHVDRSITEPATFIQTNLTGTFTLLESARQFWLEEEKFTEKDCLFHHISTDEVFGSLTRKAPAFTETLAYSPNSPYSASKAGADHLVHAYHHTYQLPTTITHCSNNYGPLQFLEKFIPTVILSCLKQKKIPVYGDGSNIRDWLYVEDHCRGVEYVIKQGNRGETYNIGGNNEWANIYIVKKICAMLDKKIPQKKSYTKLISFVPDRPGHDWRYAIDTNKIKNELNWKPLETFESGLNKTIDYYIKQFCKES